MNEENKYFYLFILLGRMIEGKENKRVETTPIHLL